MQILFLALQSIWSFWLLLLQIEYYIAAYVKIYILPATLCFFYSHNIEKKIVKKGVRDVKGLYNRRINVLRNFCSRDVIFWMIFIYLRKIRTCRLHIYVYEKKNMNSPERKWRRTPFLPLWGIVPSYKLIKNGYRYFHNQICIT